MDFFKQLKRMGNKESWAKVGKGCLNCVTCQCGGTKEEKELSSKMNRYTITRWYTKGKPLQLILEKIEDNQELFNRIDAENEICAAKMKTKIDELIERGLKNDNPQIIGYGNTCNNPCYIYNLKITKICPICKCSVDEDLENNFEFSKGDKKIKNYYNTGICTEFRWNNNINIWDVDAREYHKHYDKEDPQKKEHIIINANGGQREYDINYHYMIVDGERFDFPLCMDMSAFFYHNDSVFFPNLDEIDNKNYFSNFAHKISFYYGQSKLELGQSLGGYGYSPNHRVFIYTCTSCGYKYHIIKSSPFAFAK